MGGEPNLFPDLCFVNTAVTKLFCGSRLLLALFSQHSAPGFLLGRSLRLLFGLGYAVEDEQPVVWREQPVEGLSVV
jgi:hypothetical protein